MNTTKPVSGISDQERNIVYCAIKRISGMHWWAPYILALMHRLKNGQSFAFKCLRKQVRKDIRRLKIVPEITINQIFIEPL